MVAPANGTAPPVNITWPQDAPGTTETGWIAAAASGHLWYISLLLLVGWFGAVFFLPGRVSVSGGGPIVWGLAWAACSVSMPLLNKASVKGLRADAESSIPFAICFVQMLFAAFTASLMPRTPFQFNDVIRWLPVSVLFVGMLTTSLSALAEMSVTAVVISTSLRPPLAFAAERLFGFDTKAAPSFICGSALLIVGSYLYFVKADNFKMTGLWFALLNCLFAVCDRVLQRFLLAVQPVSMDSVTLVGINNAAGAPVTLALALFLEVRNLQRCNETGCYWPAIPWIWTFLSSMVGLLIGYCGIRFQRLISASIFLLFTGANKVLVVGFDYLMGTGMSLRQLGGALLVLLGVLLCGYSTMPAAKGEPLEDSSGDEESSDDSDDPSKSLTGVGCKNASDVDDSDSKDSEYCC